MTAPVFRLPVSSTYTPEQVLAEVAKENLQDILVIGYDEEGYIYILSSRMTCAEAAFLAHKAQLWAAAGGGTYDASL
jgi:hypothetical protein